MVERMRVRILGSGTSTGVPVIGCDCAVCLSPEAKNQRLRSSVLLKLETASGHKNIVIDTTPDFRGQILASGIKNLDAVLYTHVHADHCHGFDDLRVFYFYNQIPVPIYLGADHAKELKERFSYVFRDTGYGGTAPQVDLHVIEENLGIASFGVGDILIESLRLPHGHVSTMAFRIGGFAYATDFRYFPRDCIERWRGKIHTMVASGLRFKKHETHSSIDETIEVFQGLGVKRGVLTHLSHDVNYLRDSALLPPGVEFAFDGMEIAIPTHAWS